MGKSVQYVCLSEYEFIKIGKHGSQRTAVYLVSTIC